MSVRLQVLIPNVLDTRLRKAARRACTSKEEYVRWAIEGALAGQHMLGDPIAKLSALGAPTADMDQMLADVAAGRRSARPRASHA